MTTGEREERHILPWAGERVDEVAATLRSAIAGALEKPLDGRLQDALHGVWLGHPVHPAAVNVPIGCWISAVALDATARGGDPGGGLERGARVLTGLGVVGALGAAASGAADWSRAGRTGSRIGLLHATVNIAATVAFGASLTAGRRRSRAVRRRLLGLVLVGAGGWLGGKLSYGESIGPDRNADAPVIEEFVAVMDAADLPEGQLTPVVAEGLPVVLLRRGQRIFAIGQRCSHLGGPLSEGELDGTVVTCPWHGSRFSLESGRVLSGPATHRQPCLETRVRDGRIEVREPLPGTPL